VFVLLVLLIIINIFLMIWVIGNDFVDCLHME